MGVGWGSGDELQQCVLPLPEIVNKLELNQAELTKEQRQAEG